MAAFIDLVGVMLVVPNLVFRWKEVGITPERLGAVQSIYSAAQLIGGLVIGHLGDRVLGRKIVLLLSFVGAGISYFLVGLADSVEMLVLARIIVGLTKQTMTSSNALLTRLSGPEGRAQALGRLSSAGTLAALSGQAVGGFVSSRYGRRAPCFLAASLFVLDFLLVSALLPNDRPAGAAARTTASAPSEVAASRSTWQERLGGFVRAFRGTGGRLLLLRLAYAFLMRATYSLHSLYEQQKWELTPANSGYLGTYKTGLGLAVDALLIGQLTRRLREPLILLLALVVSASNAAIEASHSTFAVYALVNLPISTVVGTLTRTTLSTLFSKAVPVAEVGAALSVLDVCNSAVGMLAPLYGGWLLGWKGVMFQPALSCAHYVILIAISQLTVPWQSQAKAD